MCEVRVVITGMGAINAGGENVDACWEGIKEKKIFFSPVIFENKNITARFFSFLRTDEHRYNRLPKSLTHFLPESGRLALESCRQAVCQAFGKEGTPTEYYDNFDCGVILGTGWGGLDSAGDFACQYQAAGITHPKSNLITMTGSMTAACAMMYGLKGYQNTIMAACATGTMAIGDAYEIIRSGRAKCMLAGGTESLRKEFSIWSIDILKALSKETDNLEGASCPFSLNRSGFVMAEGSAVVCLEEYESAVTRGATILAEVKGYAQYGDGMNITRPAEDVASLSNTIKMAIERSGLSINEVDYINAHGTSTQLNDLYETRAIRKVFGRQAYSIPVSSTKSYTGHLIGAAGSFETIVCVKSINENLMPATLNLHHPDPECDLNYLPNEHLYGSSLRVALNISAGFGGHNAALVIVKAE
uniref:beta-ketoacyl-[acyl-carrier-protein] synthase family protein n=1 Tax=Serratia TaxID=613 RepID=UPI001F4C4CF0|nr:MULTISPECIES: beta-ketoacyl-[acyl-carrier-protein] synthase family protein [Serratia]ULG12129.1 3-oxoacyl-ACP synthase [Serratia entomophila]ULG12326.1 3-oxoacyl-ACP synthase [Serratia entomophila]ULG12352.1 3-oxoacyl-ACP synthase [Serratia entomophila]ULG15956.1 3-oxoacyl-ACP synthase [Serratia proteamaculans]ULG18446.1 3-oxoacyl-ACP synthase [Serratia proteamaculans]